MPTYQVAVSALSAMTARITVNAATPKAAAEIAGKMLGTEPVDDWEHVDGGRPALGSTQVDSVWDAEGDEELYTPPADTPESAARYAVVRRSNVSGKYYTLAQLIEVNGQMSGLAIYEPGHSWYRQFSSKAKAFKAARELGEVVPELYEEELGRPSVQPLRPVPVES